MFHRVHKLKASLKFTIVDNSTHYKNMCENEKYSLLIAKYFLLIAKIKGIYGLTQRKSLV